MPRWAKVLIWVAVFAACAAAGAYVAAHTDPFPPGVDDPGAREAAQTSGAAPTGAPTEAQRWRVSIPGAAMHAFRVGGTCESSWSGAARFPITDDDLPPDARLVLDGEGSCDFPVAQIQTEQLEVRLVPVTDGPSPIVTVQVVGRTPAGSEDLGGFATAIEQARFTVRLGTSAEARSRISDGRGGTIRSVARLVVRCVSGCD